MAYSTSPYAAGKKKFDSAYKGALDFRDGAYLKALIEACGMKVLPKTKGLQFFIIRGGAEGFLSKGSESLNASRIVINGSTTSASGADMVFEGTDLLAVFGGDGRYVASAGLSRPLSIRLGGRKPKTIWTERTANKTYNAWDGQQVTLYFNRNFSIRYYGLRVNDSLGLYTSGKVRIDMHKREATNGCIFILDPAQPANLSGEALSAFEPALIKAVQAAIGAKTGHNIGTIHMGGLK
jgi:hypothetical protein